MLWFHHSRQAAASPPRTADRGAALLQVLDDLRGAADPALRARLAAPADASTARLAALLMRGDSPLLAEAICLAGTMDAAELLAPLRSLAANGPEHLRSAALMAAGHLEPWSDADLVAHFASPVRDVVIAAVGIAAACAVRPVAQLLPLLEHDDAGVRDAALAALPVPLPDRLVEAELTRARELQSPTPQMLLAIGRGTNRADVEQYLVALLDHADASVRLAVLDALAQKRGVLLERDCIAGFVHDGGRPVLERAAAVWCCECTATLDGLDQLLEAAPGDALLDYSLGRCLLCRLDPRAFARLLHVLEAGDSQAPQAVFLAAQQDARDLLGTQAGEGADMPADRLRDWVRDASQVVPVPLPPSAIATAVQHR